MAKRQKIIYSRSIVHIFIPAIHDGPVTERSFSYL